MMVVICNRGGGLIIELLNSAENVLDIIFLLGSQTSDGLGLNDISKLTNINKSTVHKILRSLKNRNLVEQNLDTKRYRLGVGLLPLGARVLKNLDLREVAHPLIVQLASECENTVTLGIRSGNNLTFIDRVDGRENVRFYCDIGKVTPFNGGAAAKALLAHLKDDEIKEILSIIEEKKFTQKTIGREVLAREIGIIREKGYSISDEEVDIGVLAIGAPVFNHEGVAVAGIAVAGLKYTFSEDKLEYSRKLLLEYSKKISDKLGYKTP